MTAAPRSPLSSDWRDLASLGEQIVSAPSLAAQRDRIIAMTSRLVDGDVDVWLRESLFRLPGAEEEAIFPKQPPMPGMQRAIKYGRTTRKQKRDRKNGASSHGTWAAFPLADQDIALGALQVTRPNGPEFKQEELHLLEGLAGVVTVSLVASHRVAVERFRLNQLHLVSEVSEQIANVMNLDELATRVTELIQKTFHYYYVAIFTIYDRSGPASLRFRSSAMAPRKDKRKAKVALEVETGQGLIGQAVDRKERIVVADVRKDARYRFIDALPETRSEAVIPLKIKDRLLGVLDVQSDQINAFHPNDLLILSALADTTARAVEGARLYGDLRRRADQLTLISEVSKSVSSSLELGKLMTDVADLIHDRFGFPYVQLFTVHPNRGLIKYQAGSGVRSNELAGYSLSLHDAEGIIPWVAREGQMILANNVKKDKRYRASPQPPQDTKSELCVPLLYDQEVVGVLDIQSNRINAFAEDERRMFEAVADNIATAIHNADLYRSEQWRRQVADGLREVAGLISADADLDDVLEAILAELERNLTVDVAAIWLLDDDDLYLAASNSDEENLEKTLFDSPESYEALMRVVDSEGPQVRKPSDPIWVSGLAAGFDQDYSALAVPLRLGDQPLGVITLAHSTPGRYGHEARTMTTTFASYAAVAIENARLFDAAQEQAYASAALLQVAQAVVSLNDLDEILGTIIRIMPILVGINRAALYRWDSERGAFSVSHEFGFSNEEQAILTEREFKRGAFPLLDCAREENRILTGERPSDADLGSWLAIRPTVESEAEAMSAERLLMAVPLCIKNDMFGVMLIEEAENARRFRTRRLEIINGIAQQVALAIQNDLLQQEMVFRERLETEVQLARQIQQTFIPQSLPTHPSWQLAARWRTARQVGGDFYDVIELADGKLGLFIADVADKGMPAALFMALTRTLIRAAVKEAHSPSEVLSRVNEQLLPDTQQGMFVTAIYGELDVEAGEFTFVNAGHNPPFWMKANGDIEKLTRTAVALGVIEQPAMEQRSILLGVDDLLLLYTDGVTESFSPAGELFGEDRLIEAMKSYPAQNAEEALEIIEGCLNEFSDPLPPGDDLTMLAV